MDVADHFARKPALGDAVRVAAARFGAGLEIIRPLSNPAGWRRDGPRPGPQGSPAYGSAFSGLGAWLGRDREVLEGRGQQVLRPVVLLLIHHGPDRADPWPPAWDQLVRSSAPPILTALSPAGPAAEFADAIVHPSGRSRAYQAVGDFGSAVSALIAEIGRRQLDVGATGAAVPDPLPDTAELGGTAVSRTPEWVARPPALPEPPPEPPADVLQLPDSFVFDRHLGRFVTAEGADTVVLPRRDVERAVDGLVRRGTR